MNGEREVIASTGGGSSKSAGNREQSDADSVGNGTMPNTGTMDGGSGATSGSAAGEGGEGTYSGEEQREGDFNETESDGQVIELPDDIPVDGSGDDVVGRQIREAAISMQDIDPKAADALWDEYRKHTGIK
jgi:hypothetical protein